MAAEPRITRHCTCGARLSFGARAKGIGPALDTWSREHFGPGHAATNEDTWRVARRERERERKGVSDDR